jgi:hypothetical protein
MSALFKKSPFHHSTNYFFQWLDFGIPFSGVFLGVACEFKGILPKILWGIKIDTFVCQLLFASQMFAASCTALPVTLIKSSPVFSHLQAYVSWKCSERSIKSVLDVTWKCSEGSIKSVFRKLIEAY